MRVPRGMKPIWLAGSLLLMAAGCGRAQTPAAPPMETQKKVHAAALVMSPGVLGGSPVYQSWPLILSVRVWRKLPTDAKTAPQPLMLKAKQGAWGEALVVTVKNAPWSMCRNSLSGRCSRKPANTVFVSRHLRWKRRNSGNSKKRAVAFGYCSLFTVGDSSTKLLHR